MSMERNIDNKITENNILDLSNSELKEIPNNISDNITYINLKNNNIKEVDLSLFGNNVTKIDLSHNNIHKVYGYTEACEIDLSYNRISDFNLDKTYSLKNLDLSNNIIGNIDWTNKFSIMDYVNLSHNNIQKLPTGLKSTELIITDNLINGVDYIASFIRYLDLTNNKIRYLPEDTMHLKMLHVEYNLIENINFKHSKLICLNVSNNKLNKLKLNKSITSCDASNNFIKEIDYSKDVEFKYLDLRNNCINIKLDIKGNFVYLDEIRKNTKEIIKEITSTYTEEEKISEKENKLTSTYTERFPGKGNKLTSVNNIQNNTIIPLPAPPEKKNSDYNLNNTYESNINNSYSSYMNNLNMSNINTSNQYKFNSNITRGKSMFENYNKYSKTNPNFIPLNRNNIIEL